MNIASTLGQTDTFYAIQVFEFFSEGESEEI